MFSLFYSAKLVPHGLAAYHHHHHHHHHHQNHHQYVTPTKPILCSASSHYHHHHHHHHHHHRNSTCYTSTRRSLLLLLPTALSLPASASDIPLDTTITDRVFLDLSICPTYFRAQAQAQDVPLCSDSEPLGRVVLGLYGKLLPITVSNFKAMCTSSVGSSYKNTFIHKVLPGQFLVGGRQGRKEKGEVIPPLGLLQNKETVDSRAFMLDHSRPGVVSLCLSENDDDDDIKLDPDYHNVEFLITTGPGPCPQLDGRNIVFGVVLEGMDVVRQIASIPTYKPGERIKLFNDLAEFLGDGRAENARNLWDRPLKSIYVSDCGELKVAKPSLTPSLP